jgi:hypothetical protein
MCEGIFGHNDVSGLPHLYHLPMGLSVYGFFDMSKSFY